MEEEAVRRLREHLEARYHMKIAPITPEKEAEIQRMMPEIKRYMEEYLKWAKEQIAQGINPYLDDEWY